MSAFASSCENFPLPWAVWKEKFAVVRKPEEDYKLVSPWYRFECHDKDFVDRRNFY